MYVCVCVCVCERVATHTHTHTQNTHKIMSVRVCMYACMRVCMYPGLYVCVCASESLKHAESFYAVLGKFIVHILIHHYFL